VRVHLCEVSPPHPAPPPGAAQAGLGRIQANLASRVKKGRMKEEAAKAAMALVKVRRGCGGCAAPRTGAAS
jgi:3-hydroxyacyl-CoA dehydrogenase